MTTTTMVTMLTDLQDEILSALRNGDGDTAAVLVEAHLRAFDEQIRAAVTAHLESPLAG